MHESGAPIERRADAAIGVLGAAAIGIGGMVGGGIFAVLGVAAEQAGGATPLAFAAGGLVAALTAASYSRLTARYRSAGGTVAIVDGVFGIDAVTGSVNIVLWAGYIATTALYAAAFGHYAATLFPGGTDPAPWLLRVLVLAGIAIPWIINLANAGVVARTEGMIVAIKLGILLLVIAAGVPAITADRLSPSAWPSPLSIVAAGMLIFVAYEGFELIANAAADVRNPGTTLGRAFALSVGSVIVLYVAISIVVVGTLAPDEIVRAADFALAQSASASLGRVGFTLVAVSAVLATLSAINATLYGAARLSFTVATEGELPDRLERRAWNQPIGLHITAAAGLAIAVGLPLASISALASAIFLVVFGAVNAAGVRTASRWGPRAISAGGLAGCAASLVVLVVESVHRDPVAMVSLVLLVGSAMAAEHLYLSRRRAGGDART